MLLKTGETRDMGIHSLHFRVPSDRKNICLQGLLLEKPETVKKGYWCRCIPFRYNEEKQSILRIQSRCDLR
jgi:hypothetical protein